MPLRTQNWGNIHPAVYRHALEPVQRVQASLPPRWRGPLLLPGHRQRRAGVSVQEHRAERLNSKDHTTLVGAVKAAGLVPTEED